MRNGKNAHLWFEFYAEPLKAFWKNYRGRKLEDLYDLISLLSGLTVSTVKDHFNRLNTLSEKLSESVFFLLIETNFYEQFFDLGMTTRLETFNSARLAEKYYKLIKMSLMKKDGFWERWIELYELRYSNEEYNREEKKKRYGELKAELRDNQAYFVEKFKNLKSHKRFHNIYENIKERYEIFDAFFKMSFHLNYVGFLRNTGYFFENDNSNFSNYQQWIKNALTEAGLCLESVGKRVEKHKELYNDYRMYHLYKHGSDLIGDSLVPFINLEEKERKCILEISEKDIDLMKPEKSDTLQYRIWFQYYRLIHRIRDSEHSLKCGEYGPGRQKLLLAYNSCEDLEKLITGQYVRILLKVKYHKRNLHFLITTIESYFIEKELESPYRQAYTSPKERHETMDSVLDGYKKLLPEIRRGIFES